MKVLVAVLALALAVAALCLGDRVGSLPASPHQHLFTEGTCTSCHATYLGEPDPHVFILPIIEICMRESCHTAEKIGRSHPVGVDVTKSSVVGDVPEIFPLEDDTISCGSCHNLHGEWLSPTQCYPKQQPEVFLVGTEPGIETPYYRTYSLRLPGDPVEGFTALCNSCHSR